MKNRQMFGVGCYFLLFVFLLSSCARRPSVESVSALKQQRFSPLASSQMELAGPEHALSQRTPGRYPYWMDWFLNDFMGWNPLGRSLVRSQRCESKASQWTNFENLGDYFKDCEEVIKNDSLLANLQGLLTMTIDMRLDLHPFFQRVVFNLPEGVKLKGYLGLKDTSKSRPMVILRSGVYANIEEARAEMYLLLQLFEQSHFNFLVVENMSGTDFIHNNPQKLAFGGYDEGLQNLWLAKLLKDKSQPISRLVESLHFAGVSLGGHGVFFASFLNELNDKPIDSFLGVCPVLQMPGNLDHLLALSGYEGFAVNYWSKLRLTELVPRFEATEDRSTPLSSTVDLIEKNYSGAVMGVQGVKLPMGMTDSKDFLGQNDFTARAVKQMQEGVVVPQSPMLILGTDVDLLVPFTLNTGWMKKQKGKGLFPRVTVQRLKYGNHCSLPDAYQWRPVASLLQSYVNKHTKNFKLMSKNLTQSFETNFLFEDEDVKRARFYVEWDEAKSSFWIRYQFFVMDRPYTLDFNMPPQALDMQFSGPTLTRYEQRMAVRWLYQNLSMHFTSDEDETMTAHLQWFVVP